MSMHHVILVLEQPLIPVQAEMELKKGQDNKKALFYFDKAVELNGYDETALVARSRQENSFKLYIFFLSPRCHHSLGRNADAICDARAAVERNNESLLAREALGKAFYSAGQFEHAMAQFYRANRFIVINRI